MAKPKVFDAYILLSGNATETQQVLQGAILQGGRWSGRAVGNYNGVVAVTADNRFDLERIIARQSIGSVVLDVLRRRGRRPCPVKRTSLPPNWVEAFAIINAQAGAAQSVRGQVRQLGGVAASATVRGSADVLAHFQASDAAGLATAVGQLANVDGIATHHILQIHQVMPPP